ncbi:hypothetical protein [Micromonospora palythoicola]|uniref:hypothetical protein n=1 Tax=Micromonospora palythoicola TaxID=3120507 RepID=UPI002FCDEA35
MPDDVAAGVLAGAPLVTAAGPGAITSRLFAPERGPRPQRPYACGGEVPHTPLRPMWCCRHQPA